MIESDVMGGLLKFLVLLFEEFSELAKSVEAFYAEAEIRPGNFFAVVRAFIYNHITIAYIVLGIILVSRVIFFKETNNLRTYFIFEALTASLVMALMLPWDWLVGTGKYTFDFWSSAALAIAIGFAAEGVTRWAKATRAKKA